MKSIIGKKIGMTSVFDATGKQTAVTIIEAGPCVVTQKKTVATDGYNALQIAFGDKKEKHSIKAEVNHFAKAQTSPKNVMVSMVLVDSLMVSMIVQELLDLSVTHLMRREYLKE